MRMLLKGVVVPLLLLLVSIHADESVSGIGVRPRGYGDPCTCDRDCDISQWLTCQEGVCLCLSNTFQFDHHRHSCVVRLGQKCFEVAGEKYPDLPPFIRCVEGAFCSISVGGLCACNTYGYYESVDGTRCEAKKEFGIKCGNSMECKTDACSGGICSCRDGQYYNVDDEKCLGLVESFCFTDVECTMNAVCDDRAAKCVCGAGFSATLDQKCALQLRMGDNCSSSVPCNNPSLSCLQNRCGCRYPLHQIQNQAIDSCCQSLVGSAPCDHDSGCVFGANCVRDVATGFSECRCGPDYVEIEDGSCQRYKTFGAACITESECDPVTPLVCKDGRCQCIDSLSIFDPERRTCRGLHGFRGCTNTESCTQFANCVQYNAKLPAKCLCQTPSYKPDRDHNCIPAL